MNFKNDLSFVQFWLSLFEFDVLNCLLDGVFGQHAAMEFNRGEFEILSNVY